MTERTKSERDLLAPLPDHAPAVPFTEDEAFGWLASNGQQSVRLMAKLWGWHPSKVQRFMRRVRQAYDPGDTPPDTPPTVPTDTPSTVSPKTDTADEAGFDYRRAECVLPMRTSVFAYVDQETGDLWISASDALRRCDTELRINAEDVAEFVDRLVELVEPAHRSRS
jgi:hypothetical protein